MSSTASDEQAAKSVTKVEESRLYADETVRGFENFVEWLDALEVRQELDGGEGRTVLHIAAAANRVDFMDLLHWRSDAVTLAAALARKDDFGYTPLHGTYRNFHARRAEPSRAEPSRAEPSRAETPPLCVCAAALILRPPLRTR